MPVPPEGAYTGAYIDFGETEDHVTLEAIETFEKLVGKHQAIVASSSFWGRGGFPVENARIISDHGAVPLLYWSPWGPPYEQGQRVARDPWSLQRIVAGDCDAYIDAWAAAARAFARPLLVSFACEPNSDWFPWSGHDNGGERGGGPELYKRAYRHAVDRVRAAGATNVAWVFHANSSSHPERPWNAMAAYYPGADYVDWLGMSVYGQITPGKDSWDEWNEAMDIPYKNLCALDPDKPVMLAEWGVGEFPEGGNKAELRAYRQGVSAGFWLDTVR